MKKIIILGIIISGLNAETIHKSCERDRGGRGWNIKHLTIQKHSLSWTTEYSSDEGESRTVHYLFGDKMQTIYKRTYKNSYGTYTVMARLSKDNTLLIIKDRAAGYVYYNCYSPRELKKIFEERAKTKHEKEKNRLKEKEDKELSEFINKMKNKQQIKIDN